MEYLRQIQDYYIGEQRKLVTIDKLKLDPFLDLPQVDKLKLADAIYSTTFYTFHTPFLYLSLRSVIKPGKLFQKWAVILLAYVPFYYGTTQITTKYAWPLVEEVGYESAREQKNRDEAQQNLAEVFETYLAAVDKKEDTHELEGKVNQLVQEIGT